ncbi:MAG: type IX secretion system membrane protein PorP/SprF [Prevotella sp.]|nr:type IX secretion system membrane protein PorP/SprF [Prevotella sp.]
MAINEAISRYNHVFRPKFILLLTLVLAPLCCKAQYDVPFSHYWGMEPYFNPGAVGKEAKLNIAAAYAMSFVGFENNPKTMYFSGDMPFTLGNSVNGVGIQLMSDQIGLFTHQRLSGQFAHKKKMFGGTLSIGVQAGLLTEKLDGSELDLDQTGDPAFNTSEVNGQVIDFGVGLYYTRGRWYVGLSGQHLTSPTIELGETNELKVDATFYLTSGYNIKLRNPFLTIHPSMLVRYDGLEYRGDVTARLEYNNENKHMYLGAGYSPGNSITAFIGGSFQGIQLGYSYEFYTSGISLGNGSHELFVNYQTDINLTKKGKNKHKSVRIL